MEIKNRTMLIFYFAFCFSVVADREVTSPSDAYLDNNTFKGKY